MPIDPAALEALRLLLDAAGRDRVVMIGASVPLVLIDLRYGLTGGRTTRDVDAALAHRESVATVRVVLATIDDEYARPIRQIVSDERRLPDDDRRRRELYRLFRVFSASLAGAGQSAVSPRGIQTRIPAGADPAGRRGRPGTYDEKRRSPSTAMS